MFSDLPKVAHPVAGRPLLQWVLGASTALEADSTMVVVGHGADTVRAILPPGVGWALQAEQLGTGHAARIGLENIAHVDADDVVVILYGDTPLLSADLMRRLGDLAPGDTGHLVVTVLDDPTGYGRVIRDPDGSVMSVVEERDCDPSQREIQEVNAGMYAIRAESLRYALDRLTDDNQQGEYYLTDVVGILSARGDKLVPVKATPEEISGINSHDQLALAQAAVRSEINQRLMESGVSMLDPDRTYVDAGVVVEPGASILPGVYLKGSTVVRAGARVGPDVFAVDSEIGAGSLVWYSVLRSASIGEDCEVGPYASLRPGTTLERGAKVGTFVETKNTTLGEGAKANHLSYLGDASVGARSNIGAGTVTVNYDGYEKHRTEIGEEVFIGSDTMLVAPVKVGDRAMTGAGSVITKDVAEGALAVERGEQKEIPGYSDRRKAKRAALDAED
jgi:bifunctional UDP-N-acetylglucosamine pyrophosphorylase / glucosamine-1-phosphate N-acetyltransferase